jgi:hypothetical protein
MNFGMSAMSQPLWRCHNRARLETHVMRIKLQ